MQEAHGGLDGALFVPGFCLALGIFTWLSRRK